MITDRQSVPGRSVHAVDHSAGMLGGQGESPTPQTRLTHPQKVFRPSTLESLSSFFYRAEGSNPVSPKVGVDPSYYLDYTANLDLFDGEVRYPGAVAIPKRLSTQCKPRYIVLQCGCGRSIVPSACMSLACPGCAPFISKRRQLRAFERLSYTIPEYFTRKSTRAVIYTILTVPEAVRIRYVDPKVWQRLRGRVWKILKEKFNGLYGVEASHPIGSGGEHFHPHLNFLWVNRRGTSPFIDVKLLREAWAEILDVDEADVHTEYTFHHAQIMHWSKYVTRTFPGFHWWTGPIRWFGSYPKMRKHPKPRCEKCGQHYYVIGHIEGFEVDTWNRIGFYMGIDPPWENDDRITHYFKPSI